MGYVTLQRVKETLMIADGLQQGDHRLSFSQSYENLSAYRTNNGNDPRNGIQLLRVRIDDSYAGLANFLIVFTNATDFTAYIKPMGNEVEIPIGTGNISTLFTAYNPFEPTNPPVMFTIQPADWAGGTPVANDMIRWTTRSKISNDVGERFIDMADAQIDSWLFESRRPAFHNASLTVRYYVANPPVPDQIAIMSENLSAFLIVSRVVQTAKLAESPVFQLWQTARNMAKIFLGSDAIPRRGPTWATYKPVIPVSLNDPIGTSFLGLDWSQDQYMEQTWLDVRDRLHELKVDFNCIDMTG